MALLWASKDPSEPLWFYCDLHSSPAFYFSANSEPDLASQNDVDPLGSGSGSASLAAVNDQIKKMLHLIGLFHGPFKRNFCFKVFYVFFPFSSSHIFRVGKKFDILYERICLLLFKIMFQMVLGWARTSWNSKRRCCASPRWPKGIFYLHFTADESVESPLIASPLVFWIIPLIDILLILLLRIWLLW